jgi:hypothetical protein
MLQVETFMNKFGLKAIAINSVHGSCTKEVIQVCPMALLPLIF